MANLFRDLEDTWERDGESADARSALQGWATTRPALARFTTPAELVRLAHRRDASARDLIEAITEEAASDPWAARTVLQALLPGLAALASQHLDLVGTAREPFATFAELDQFLVCTAYERITQVAAEVPLFRLRTVLDCTWARLRAHARAHRRDHDRRITLTTSMAASPRPLVPTPRAGPAPRRRRRAPGAAPRRRPPRLHHPGLRPHHRGGGRDEWVTTSTPCDVGATASSKCWSPRCRARCRPRTVRGRGGTLRLMPSGEANGRQRGRRGHLPGHRPRRPRHRLGRCSAGRPAQWPPAGRRPGADLPRPRPPAGQRSGPPPGMGPTLAGRAPARPPSTGPAPASPPSSASWLSSSACASSDAAAWAWRSATASASTPRPGWPRPATCAR